MIAPVLALIAWTFVMWAWMYATRIPAMQRAKIDVAELSRTGKKLELPPEVSRVADNYNHLHEQPTIFYALALAAQLAGAADATNVGLAWGYVGSRVVHSLEAAHLITVTDDEWLLPARDLGQIICDILIEHVRKHRNQKNQIELFASVRESVVRSRLLSVEVIGLVVDVGKFEVEVIVPT